jgi:protein-S-isoprenylcysteine O-methyltransferase Ste14
MGYKKAIQEEDMNNFIKWQNQNSPKSKKVFFLLIGALIFPIFIPAVLAILLPRVDKMFGIGSFFIGNVNIITGILLILFGGSLAIWTIFSQIKLASGTPFPMLPTKKLIIIGPFKYCRNPMTLGTILAYFGVAIMVGSFASLLFVILLGLFLIAYLIFVEEKELALRFGQDYTDYKEDTPFIIPCWFASEKKK